MAAVGESSLPRLEQESGPEPVVLYMYLLLRWTQLVEQLEDLLGCHIPRLQDTEYGLYFVARSRSHWAAK